MGIAIVIIISIGFGALHYYIAEKKGLNGQIWCIVGLLFGPFSLPLILLRKSRN
jgi:hypothetical protein